MRGRFLLLLFVFFLIMRSWIYDLFNERLIQEVWTSYAEIEHVNFLQDGIVEGVKKPRGVRDL